MGDPGGAGTGPGRDAELLTVQSAAVYLKMARSTVYRLIADGRLTVVNVGRKRPKLRVHIDALRAFVASNQIGAVA